MSAWELGRQSGTRYAADAPQSNDLLTIVGRILQWIPADVIVLFTAAITALVDEPKDAAGKWLIVGGVVMSSLFVIGGAWSERTSGQTWLTKKAKVRAAVAPVAFLIWSPTVPDSGWQELKIVSDNPAWTVIVCAVAGALLAMFLSGLEPKKPSG